MTGPVQPVREQRLVFGEAADTYDRLRPSYPARIVDAVISFARLEGDGSTPVVEVGAGTGKASVLFAARGFRLTALEPSPQMAAIARRNLSPYPDAQVLEESFENWRPEPGGFGLVFAAQSWHWLTPEDRVARAWRALGTGGALAVFWNIMVKRGNSRMARAIAAAYGGLATRNPRLAETGPAEANDWVSADIEASGLFSPVRVVHERWQRSFDTEDWLGLMSTQSDHRMLDDDLREALFDRLRSAVDSHGGLVEVDYVTALYMARARAAGR